MALVFELVEYLGMSAADLSRVISTAPARYRVYEIPKRHGGTRTIAQPSRELKAIQRFILEKKLSAFPIHPSAAAYVAGRNIFQNALAHVEAGPILKLDFQNFFPSIKVRDWRSFVRLHPTEGIELGELGMYARILFWGQQKKSTTPRCLSIGAPTSPALSNILLFDLDVTLSRLADQLGVQYTRYADDITVSGPAPDPILAYEVAARDVVRAFKSPALIFNEAKRGFFRKGQRRMVTGLVLTPKREISLGRSRKRKISAMLHKSSLGQLDPSERSYLKGMLGFSIANEPAFIGRLRTKYGDQPVDDALRFFAPKRDVLTAPV